jgi:hypothetical protein
MTEPKEPTISTDAEYLLRHYGTCWCRKCETIRALLAEREASEWECAELRAKLEASERKADILQPSSGAQLRKLGRGE